MVPSQYAEDSMLWYSQAPTKQHLEITLVISEADRRGNSKRPLMAGEESTVGDWETRGAKALT